MQLKITLDTEAITNYDYPWSQDNRYADAIVEFLNGRLSSSAIAERYQGREFSGFQMDLGRLLFWSVANTVSVAALNPKITLLPLDQYPAAIASARLQVNLLNSTMRSARQEMEDIENEVDKEVAFDSTLKNETQRSTRRHDLLKQNSHYAVLKQELNDASDLKVTHEIELDRLRGEFSAARSLVQQKMLSSIASTSPYFGDDDFEDFLNLQVQKRLQQEIEAQSLNN